MAIFGWWGAMPAVQAAIDRERSQEFYEEALTGFKAEEYSTTIIQLRNALQQDPDNLPARILLGETLLREDQPRAAIKELEKALSLGGDENLVLVPLARAYMETAQPQLVITGLVPEGHTPTVDGELHLLQAAAYSMLGNRKLSEDAYLAAGVLLPVDPRPLVGRANIALRRGKRDKADKLIGQAIALAPDSFEVWMFKALAHRDFSQPGAALKSFARALEIRPTSGRALAARAALWLDLGNVEAAKEDLEKASDLGIDTLETIYLRTLMLFREGKSLEAREVLRESADEIRAIKEDVREKLPNTKLMLGVVAYFEGNFEEAVSHLNQFLVSARNHLGAKRYLAAAYLNLKLPEDAIRVYRPGPRSEPPNDPMALSMLAEAYRSIGDYAKAERYYETALKLAPNVAGLGVNLAMSRMDAGKPEQAIEELKWFVEKFPELVEAHVQLSRVYVKVGRVDDAVTLIAALVNKNPDNASVHNIAGATLLAAGNVARARDHLQMANAIDPSLILPQLNLARLARMENHPASAETQYRSLLQVHPFHVPSGLELAQLLLDQGELDEAAERIAKVLEVEPKSFDAHTLQLQILLLKQEPIERVRNTAYEFLKKFPEEPKADYVAGKISAAIGDADEAKLQFRHAVQKADFDTAILLPVAHEQIALRDLNGALWSLTKALQGSPNNLEAGVLRADVLIQLKDFANADDQLNTLTENHGTPAPIMIKRGDWYMAQDQTDEALPLYAEAHRIAPIHLSVRTLFRALVADKQNNAAVELMRTWLSKHPDDIALKRIFGQALMHMKRYRMAREVYEALKAGGLEDVILLNNLAMIYHFTGDGRALRTAKQAHELASDAWSVLDTYGWILTQNDEPENGLALLREAFARSSTNPEVRYHIGVALMILGREEEALEELEAAVDSGKAFTGEEDAEKLIDKLRVSLADQG